MREKIDARVPRYGDLIQPTFMALKNLGGSGNNNEILEQIIKILALSNDIIDIPHKGNSGITELSYQAAWSRTYMKKYGVIENSARSVWSIKPVQDKYSLKCSSVASTEKTSCLLQLLQLLWDPRQKYLKDNAYHKGLYAVLAGQTPPTHTHISTARKNVAQGISIS